MLGPDGVRRAQALVRMGWGHPDVDDRDVGMRRPNDGDQLLPVSGLADDFEPGLDEQPSDPFAEQ